MRQRTQSYSYPLRACPIETQQGYAVLPSCSSGVHSMSLGDKEEQVTVLKNRVDQQQVLLPNWIQLYK